MTKLLDARESTLLLGFGRLGVQRLDLLLGSYLAVLMAIGVLFLAIGVAVVPIAMAIAVTIAVAVAVAIAKAV